MPLARVSGNSLTSESVLTASLLVKTIPHHRRQPFPINFGEGFFLFLKNIFLKWVYDSGFSVGTSEGSNLLCSLTTEYTHKIPSPSNLQIRFLHIGVFFRFSLPYMRREAKAMKKIIILLLALLMSACSAVKPAETLSSMQTEPTAETTVAETTAPEETTESTPKETETAIKVPKEETTAPLIIEQPEQKATPEITTETITETPVESATMETTAEPPTTPQMPV